MGRYFSFLDYLDNFSESNLLIVERAAQFRTREELATFIGVSLNTVKNWFAKDPDSPKKRIPNIQTWNYMLFQLEARRKGFDSLKQLVESL